MPWVASERHSSSLIREEKGDAISRWTFLKSREILRICLPSPLIHGLFSLDISGLSYLWKSVLKGGRGDTVWTGVYFWGRESRGLLGKKADALGQ